MSIIQMDMMTRNKISTVVARVRNFLVHHRRTWLPYGAILAFLTGVWFVWDGPGESTTQIRETKSETRSSSPVFSTTDKNDGTEVGGTMVYSTASSVRTKPLPDLFGQPVPKKEAVTATSIAPIKMDGKAATPTPASLPVQWPAVQGVMQSGAKRLVMLRSGQETKVCAAGEWIDGFYVEYVHEWAVGLSKDGQSREFPL